ncbi:MAG TPA: bifunctional 2-C-methyl-D-erythritol 4-phosphate cytidylyltransferase/2-C-methyl-D-erythritol 2,4-cyclodiphosphate synthase [Alphaproteobacteria bacterium]|nr:bifunctional 2-C-methyl-D-erythritol 4-phosphate cytidylyltransferase/2-C-methyl-D-erythritol 2,4-cyclodiphosphate synthase [Alphaproteobacteria bacterium]
MNPNGNSCAALIVAGGSGERFGTAVPKQYLDLAGKPVIRRAVEAFLDHPAVGRVRVVANPAHRDLLETALAGIDVGSPIPGGSTRQESVRRGLEALAAEGGVDRVLIHDAARPLIDAATIERVARALDAGPAAIAAVPVTDTLKRGADGLIAGTVDRDGMWRAQTPQGFRLMEILSAHRAAAGRVLTDDAAVAEHAGIAVTLVPGHVDNLKVTTEQDLRRAERLLAPALPDTRVGGGFDVHRFGPGDHVMLCGVPISHDRGLEGHSDADVGLHALTDAILGAIGAGDIGQHFPPSDPRWRGADSGQFLRHAVGLVAGRGGCIAHADVTLICELPKVGPHRARMIASVAALLGISEDRVSVKATTSERLGFTGRGEGIAAQAVATIRLP